MAAQVANEHARRMALDSVKNIKRDIERATSYTVMLANISDPNPRRSAAIEGIIARFSVMEQIRKDIELMLEIVYPGEQ